MVGMRSWQAAPAPAPVQAYAPDLSRRVRLVVATLCTVIARRFAAREPHLAGPLRGNPLPTGIAWPLCRLGRQVANHGCQRQALLAEPAAAEGLAPPPAAPAPTAASTPATRQPSHHPRQSLSLLILRRRRDSPASAPPPSALLPLRRLIGTSPGGFTR